MTGIDLLRAVYAAFNARDIEAALARVTPDVVWPRAFKGGFVRGRDAVRAYWTEQWSEINPHVEPVAFHPEGRAQVRIEVHQVVRDLAGAVLADAHVGHRFTIEHGAIRAMEVCPPALADPPSALGHALQVPDSPSGALGLGRDGPGTPAA